jgi:hypothetical protein
VTPADKEPADRRADEGHAPHEAKGDLEGVDVGRLEQARTSRMWGGTETWCIPSCSARNTNSRPFCISACVGVMLRSPSRS